MRIVYGMIKWGMRSILGVLAVIVGALAVFYMAGVLIDVLRGIFEQMPHDAMIVVEWLILGFAILMILILFLRSVFSNAAEEYERLKGEEEE